jgi:DNA replication protein DnaC
MERDLAMASIGGNLQTLKELENKQKELIDKAESLLKRENLTLRDLTPVYACEKCNDTGYVGTKRCDCYDKKVL